MRRVIVVGGGASGLILARELTARGAGDVDVTVYEAQDRPGGKAWTDREAGYTIERGPEAFLDSAPATLALAQELGLSDHLLPASASATRRYLFTRGALRPLPTNPAAFLGSGILSLRGRLAVLGEPFRAGHWSDDESVATFARRRLGHEAAGTLVGAMVRGVYAGDAEALSMPSSFPRLTALEREHGSLVRALIALKRARRNGGGPAGPGGRLTSFEGGMADLGRALARALGPRLFVGHPAWRVVRAGAGWRVEFTDGSSEFCDVVAVATEPWSASRLLAEASPDLAAALGEIPAAPAVVVALGFTPLNLRRRLDGFGFLVPPHEPLRMLGCLWSSATFTHRAPPGRVLLRVLLGGAGDAGVLDLQDDQLTRIVLSELDLTIGLRGSPEMVRIIRWPKAIPQYTVGHGARLTRIAGALLSLRGLHLLGNGYRGISLNDCVMGARAVADTILSVSAPVPV